MIRNINQTEQFQKHYQILQSSGQTDTLKALKSILSKLKENPLERDDLQIRKHGQTTFKNDTGEEELAEKTTIYTATDKRGFTCSYELSLTSKTLIIHGIIDNSQSVKRLEKIEEKLESLKRHL